MPPELPSHVGPYRILELLDRGGTSPVFKAEDPAHDRIVAVKLLSPRLLEDPVARERFERETDSMVRLGHSNVVQTFEAGRDADRPYLVREYLEGTSLDRLLRQRRLTTAEAFHVMRAICRGLAHAHQNGVVHRSLTPRDILVSPDLSVVKITDFGRIDLLTSMTGTLNTGAISLGAFHYLAPEQVEAEPGKDRVDHRADLYAAGVIFHEMLTGRAPGGRFVLPSQLNSELPPEVDVLVFRCLEKNPAERYGNALELLADLTRLEETLRLRLASELKGITQAGSKLLAGGPEGQAAGNRRTALIVTVLLILVVAAVAIYLIAR
ncbi:MAG TPA: serine/threonine-protein kinase [Thermoanaerobaculia bacterium]|nr:serine/threonine-protein kinase [Thermoanaerobaculia bacterium]